MLLTDIGYPAGFGLRALGGGQSLHFHGDALAGVELVDRGRGDGRDAEERPQRRSARGRARAAVPDRRRRAARHLRGDEDPAMSPSSSGHPDGSSGPREFSADEIDLFRFSAVTWNAHRIHYDAARAARRGAAGAAGPGAPPRRVARPGRPLDRRPVGAAAVALVGESRPGRRRRPGRGRGHRRERRGRARHALAARDRRRRRVCARTARPRSRFARDDRGGTRSNSAASTGTARWRGSAPSSSRRAGCRPRTGCGGRCTSRSARRPSPSASAARCGSTTAITTTHRGHGHCLAKGARRRRGCSPSCSAAPTATARAARGSMHIADPASGHPRHERRSSAAASRSRSAPRSRRRCAATTRRGLLLRRGRRRRGRLPRERSTSPRSGAAARLRLREQPLRRARRPQADVLAGATSQRRGEPYGIPGERGRRQRRRRRRRRRAPGRRAGARRRGPDADRGRHLPLVSATTRATRGATATKEEVASWRERDPLLVAAARPRRPRRPRPPGSAPRPRRR